MREEGDRWRKGQLFIFVLDMKGTMLVHKNPDIEGTNQLSMKDASGNPVIQRIIREMADQKESGWFHFLWPRPGDNLPTWRSTYIRRISSPTGENYLVGAGMNDLKPERAFAVGAVNDAIGLIENEGVLAFDTIRSKTGRFVFLDTYVSVTHLDGTELANPMFPEIEGKSKMDLRDSQGTYIHREVIKETQNRSCAWVKYYWPKPGESKSYLKDTYVRKVKIGEDYIFVSCGIYQE